MHQITNTAAKVCEAYKRMEARRTHNMIDDALVEFDNWLGDLLHRWETEDMTLPNSIVFELNSDSRRFAGQVCEELKKQSFEAEVSEHEYHSSVYYHIRIRLVG